MKNLLIAALLGLATAAGLTAAPPSAPPGAEAVCYWRFAGAYRTYEEAYRKARWLQARGYQTGIKKEGGYYCVYYR